MVFLFSDSHWRLRAFSSPPPLPETVTASSDVASAGVNEKSLARLHRLQNADAGTLSRRVFLLCRHEHTEGVESAAEWSFTTGREEADL